MDMGHDSVWLTAANVALYVVMVLLAVYLATQAIHAVASAARRWDRGVGKRQRSR